MTDETDARIRALVDEIRRYQPGASHEEIAEIARRRGLYVTPAEIRAVLTRRTA